MKINHRPNFKTSLVEEHYSKKDGVPIRYVCTSALGGEEFSRDIFYRETPHPEFGNRYFALFHHPLHGIMIGNADKVEELEFDCLVTEDGTYTYSAHRHDYVSAGGAAIDGGRAYTRIIGTPHKTAKLKVKDGEMYEA